MNHLTLYAAVINYSAQWIISVCAPCYRRSQVFRNNDRNTGGQNSLITSMLSVYFLHAKYRTCNCSLPFRSIVRNMRTAASCNEGKVMNEFA